VLEFSPDGKWLIVSYKNRVVIWDVATRKELRFLWHEKNYPALVRFTSDGKSLRAAVGTPQVIIWNPEDRTQRTVIKLKKLIFGCPTDMALSPDGNTLALVGNYSRLLL